MKDKIQIFTILWLTIFTFISCGEDKSGAKKVEVVANDSESDAEEKNVETTDKLDSTSNSSLNNSLASIKVLDLYCLRSGIGGFISLSDVYPLSDHPDSLAIPKFELENKDSLPYIKLKSKYRKRFLSKTNILETDSVFIYDYSTDVLLSFSVKKLNVLAYINDYMQIKSGNQSDYMIGFEVNKHYLVGLGEHYDKALVFIGKENPFTQGQMKPIVWQKIQIEKFPFEKSNLTEIQKQFKNKKAVNAQAYSYETDSYQVFIKDYTEPNRSFVLDRHLIVIDKQNGNVVNEAMFNNTEGTSVATLNFGVNNDNFPDLKEQWTGKLFKDKPEVIFGFEWTSFGCPSINFINSQRKYVQINCDNRH